MTTYTINELIMLQAFYNASVEACGTCNDEENMSYSNAKDLHKMIGGTLQSIGGTMASLLEKGAIQDYGDSARGDKLNDFVLIDIDFDTGV
jgi:hypothetical protein